MNGKTRKWYSNSNLLKVGETNTLAVNQHKTRNSVVVESLQKIIVQSPKTNAGTVYLQSLSKILNFGYFGLDSTNTYLKDRLILLSNKFGEL